VAYKYLWGACYIADSGKPIHIMAKSFPVLLTGVL
jgi:hypothetical protein